MLTATELDLRGLRRVWRAIPADRDLQRRKVRSRVSLDEGGSLIPISERGGRFFLSVSGLPVAFECLDDAEMIAVGILLEKEGPPGG